MYGVDILYIYIQMHIDNDIIGGHHLHYDLMPSSTNVITCR